MKKRVLLLIIIIFINSIFVANGEEKISIELTKEEKKWIEEHPAIKLAPDPDFPPVEYIDDEGKYLGIASEYVKLIYEYSGVKIEIVELEDWDEVIKQAREKKIDMFGAAVETPQRKEYMKFTKPYIKIPSAIITRAEAKDNLTLEDLSDMKVAIVSNYAVNEYVKTNYPDIDVDDVPNIQTGLRKLSFGIVDAVVSNVAIATYYIEIEGISNLKISGETGFSYDLSFAVRDDWEELVNILQKVIDEIPEEKHKEIFRQWISLGSSRSEYLITFIYIMGFVVLILILIFILILIWNRALKKKVSKKTKELENLNIELENIVKHRTSELEESNRRLEQSIKESKSSQSQLLNVNEKLEKYIEKLERVQKKLIEAEKISALASLVSGVAHEINTPLGISITSSSYAKDLVQKMKSDIELEKLKKQEGLNLLDEILSSMEVLERNLSSSASMVKRFKQIAVDQIGEEKRKFNIVEYLKDIEVSVRSKYKYLNYMVEIKGDSGLEINNYPGAISQVITNLIQNSIKHGFKKNKIGRIEIEVVDLEEEILLFYTDNGVGIPKEKRVKVFEPFFTTGRGQGHIGLGLNIVYNVVTSTLKGSVEIDMENSEGFMITIKIPKEVKLT